MPTFADLKGNIAENTRKLELEEAEREIARKHEEASVLGVVEAPIRRGIRAASIAVEVAAETPGPMCGTQRSRAWQAGTVISPGQTGPVCRRPPASVAGQGRASTAAAVGFGRTCRTSGRSTVGGSLLVGEGVVRLAADRHAAGGLRSGPSNQSADGEQAGGITNQQVTVRTIYPSGDIEEILMGRNLGRSIQGSSVVEGLDAG